MNITVEKLPNCKASVTVQVPKDKHQAARDGVIKNYLKHAALPGFRRGKAPRSVVEKRFKEEIDKEVTDKLVQEGVNEAVEKEKLNVLSVANLKPVESPESGEMTFSVELFLAPEIELPEYKGLTIKIAKQEVTDASVDEVLQQQREQMATLKTVEGRPANAGDFVTISYTAKLDGEPLKGQLPPAESFVAENDNFLLKLDDANFVPGFCKQLEGISTGETREVTVTMPEEAVNTLIAGKEVVYTVTAGEIKEAELPDLDDAFAARLMEGKTLEDLRTLVRESSEERLQQAQLEEKRINAMAALREKIDFDLPENVVNNAAQRRVNELVKMNLDRGLTQDMIVENEAAILQAAGDQAKVDVKDEFLLMEIVKKEKLQVTREDMIRRISAIAQRARTAPQKVVKSLQKNNGLQNLQHSVLLAKALDVLVDNAQVEFVEEEAAPAAESEA